MKPPKIFGFLLFQLNNVTPSGTGILAFVVLLHGIGKYICLALPIGLGILLCGYDDGFRAIDLVDFVYDSIQASQLLNLSGIYIK